MTHASTESDALVSPLSRAVCVPLTEVRAGLAALRPTLFAQAFRLSRSRARADDLVQETMLRALRFEHTFAGGTNLPAWVAQVLRRVFLTQCRSHQREGSAFARFAFDPSAWSQPVLPPDAFDLPPATAAALAALPANYREAVTLVDLDQHSYKDAARCAGVPVGTIMSRLHRARKRLAKSLLDVAGEPFSGAAEVVPGVLNLAA